jgi:hypothetical protein
VTPSVTTTITHATNFTWFVKNFEIAFNLLCSLAYFITLHSKTVIKTESPTHLSAFKNYRNIWGGYLMVAQNVLLFYKVVVSVNYASTGTFIP